ncbi:Sarcolemmal membrane-associated protein [Acipenser ruthenus]|uniref:Sarcolemmal membrane-associated protein n=1 Tax=Acipenser ruthenus TaxID=7906 RepID=A0A662YMQ2_ACIRT|nr:Sarcolemmal membrane-associated protein [Acipenser ruthenus]
MTRKHLSAQSVANLLMESVPDDADSECEQSDTSSSEEINSEPVKTEPVPAWNKYSSVIQAPLPLPVDKEALHREQMLEQKLATLQRLLASTQEASESSWQNQTEDGIRKELIALQEDKHNYETTAKESLRRVLQEKIEVVRKLSEVERSLSNTEDECTHLKEMNERTQEELSELANKYNGAVNEIKDLADKLKTVSCWVEQQAGGRQEELQQKGLSEKKEQQHRIEEMEEKEQTLQARIEALQADNDFTNERLTALQVRLEQLQEKNIKEHNSLGVIDAHLENNQTAEENFLSSPERLKDELRRVNLEPGDSEQVIQHLHKELVEAQELAKSGKHKCLELQSLLEEERRASKQQTENSTKQIQLLQGRSVALFVCH